MPNIKEGITPETQNNMKERLQILLDEYALDVASNRHISDEELAMLLNISSEEVRLIRDLLPDEYDE